MFNPKTTKREGLFLGGGGTALANVILAEMIVLLPCWTAN